jgi:hypothetical protein
MSKMHLLVSAGKTNGVYYAASACGLDRDSPTKWIGTKNARHVSCKRCQKYLIEKDNSNE